MNELPEIYRRIEYLRNKGVKMKEIADHTNMAASVLSSLYSSVLPTYIGCIKKGNNEEEALDYALSQVNNVSKKRLLGNLKELKEQLYALEPAVATGQKENPFLDMLSEEMLRSVQDAYNYSGIYISYSLSSSTNALKVEPYLITTSENNGYVKVVHMSAYNTTHFGTGIFSNHQNSYIIFNERESPQMALFTIYLQLPMYDFPHMLKGLYLCLDYNRNPIARRILFIKHSDSTGMDDFLELKGTIIPKEELTEEQIPYYNYTCQPGDYIKKPMRECTGKEICMEWLYHIGVPEDQIEELATNSANTVPVMMPYIDAFFMPRAYGDRPKVVPDGSVNFAFLGQFAETPRDTIFTTEYSMRTGMESVYTLLNVDRGVPEVWGSVYDVRDLLNATVKLRDGKKATDMDMGFMEKMAVKKALGKIEGTDIEKLLKEYGVI